MGKIVGKKSSPSLKGDVCFNVSKKPPNSELLLHGNAPYIFISKVLAFFSSWEVQVSRLVSVLLNAEVGFLTASLVRFYLEATFLGLVISFYFIDASGQKIVSSPLTLTHSHR